MTRKRIKNPRPLHLRAPVVIADVPAPFEVWGKRPGGIDSRSADAHYETMTWAALNRLGKHLDAVAAEDAALFLWIFPPVLQELMRMGRAWGFEYKTKAFSWVKLYPSMAGFVVGMGYYTRANSEDVFLFTRGDPRRINADVYQIVPEMRNPATLDTLEGLLASGRVAPADRPALADVLALMRGVADRGGQASLDDAIRLMRGLQGIDGADTVLAPMFSHSQKPEEVQDRIERLFPLPSDGSQGYYLEMFARRARPGWVCLGNELTRNDIRVDLANLATASEPPVERPREGLFQDAEHIPMFRPDEVREERKKRRKKTEQPKTWEQAAEAARPAEIAA